MRIADKYDSTLYEVLFEIFLIRGLKPAEMTSKVQNCIPIPKQVSRYTNARGHPRDKA